MKANQSLQQEIAERRQTEMALKQNTEELARSNAELEQFAYVASHDLQAPLRAVAGFLRLLQQRYTAQLDSDANRFISRSMGAAQQMQTLINDLLSYSRVRTQQRSFEPVEIPTILHSILATQCQRLLKVVRL